MRKKQNLATAGNVFKPGYVPTPKESRYYKIVKRLVLLFFITFAVRNTVSMISRNENRSSNAEALTSAASTQDEFFALTKTEESLIMGSTESLIWLIAIIAIVLSFFFKNFFVGDFMVIALTLFLSSGIYSTFVSFEYSSNHDLKNVVYDAIDFEAAASTDESIVGIVNGKTITIDYSAKALTVDLTPEVKEALKFSASMK